MRASHHQGALNTLDMQHTHSQQRGHVHVQAEFYIRNVICWREQNSVATNEFRRNSDAKMK